MGALPYPNYLSTLAVHAKIRSMNGGEIFGLIGPNNDVVRVKVRQEEDTRQGV